MKVYEVQKVFLSKIAIFFSVIFLMNDANAGSFGAQIICTMREGGNEHESSWDAAYSYIKKQKGGLFKVSPNQAASQIVETVIRGKKEFDYCIPYLDKLHPDRKLQREIEKNKKALEKQKRAQEKREKKIDSLMDDLNKNYSEETIDRYSY